MTQYQIRVIDGKHWVFETTTGIDQSVIGWGFARPRDAIAYSEQLRLRAEGSNPDSADALGNGVASGDVGGALGGSPVAVVPLGGRG